MNSNRYLKEAMKIKNMKPAEFSRFIGITDSYISKMMKDTRNMDNYTCIQVSDILNIDPMKLITMTNLEREKNEEKREFFSERVKEYGFSTLKMNMVIMSVIGFSFFAMSLINSPIFQNNTHSFYILC